MRALLALVALALGVGCASATATTAADPAVAKDVRTLAAQMERIHPNLFHHVPRAEFRRAVDTLLARLPGLERDQVLVELMRIVAMTGERDGHMGLFPLATHRRPLHLLPLRVWSFPEGPYVLASPTRPDLVGARLVAIEGVPVDDVAARVRPLVTRDNAWSLKLRLPEFMLTTEVLHGLGIADDAQSATVTLERPGGERVEATLRALAGPAYWRAIPDVWAPPAPPSVPTPLWLRNRSRTQWTATLDRGRAIYAAYSSTQDATVLASQLLRRGRPAKVRRVIVDVRLNGGGDNTSYGSLLVALQRLGRKVVLLTGRVTFSAAGNFAAEVEDRTRARIVGEPPGGSPHNYGDSVQVELPALGWTVYVPPQYVEVLGRKDTRAALRVDVPVETAAAEFFAGRDAVLERALALR